MTDQDQIYDRALASIREKERIDQGFAAGLVYAAYTMGEDDRLQRWGERARVFVLLFFMALPSYFVWAFLLD